MNTEIQKKVSSTTDVRLASSVSKDVELEAVLLRSASVKSSVTDEDRPAQIETKQKFGARYEFLRPTKLNVLGTFEIELYSGSDHGRKLLALEAEYLLVYRLPEGKTHSSEEVRYFAQLNGVLHLWPYWRELVHTVVARVGLGSVTLPVYRVKPKPVTLEAEPPDAEALNARDG